MSATVVSIVLRTMLQAGLLTAAAWLLARALRRLPGVRTWIWWLVALHLAVAWMIPAAPLPLLPARVGSAPMIAPVTTAPAAPATIRTFVPHVVRTGREAVPVPWREWALSLLTVLWLGGALVHVCLMASDQLRLRRHLAAARPLGAIDPELARRADALARAAGVGPCVFLAAPDARAPFVTGLSVARIVLPETAVRTGAAEDLDLALAHELAHVRRRDLLFGWVPAVASVAWWFFPPARLAVAEYAAAREEACDRTALALTHGDPARYGRVLLSFGLDRAGVLIAARGASPHFRQLRRRLVMLGSDRSVTRRRALVGALAVVLFAVPALVPLRVTAAEAPPAPARPPAPPAAAPAPAPAATPATPLPAGAAAPLAPLAPPAPRAPRALTADEMRLRELAAADMARRDRTAPEAPRALTPDEMRARELAAADAARRSASDAKRLAHELAQVAAAQRGYAVPAAPPAPPSPASAPAPPAPPAPPRDRLSDGDVVLLHGDDMTVSGSSRAVLRAAKARKGEEDLLWFRLDGKNWAVYDPATIKRAAELYSSQGEIGEHMGRLGEQMGAMGEKLGVLGEKLGALGEKQGELSEKLAEIASQRAERAMDGKETDDLERATKDLEKQLREVSLQMKKVEAEQEALSAQQEKLGENQEQLGEKQEAEAEHAEQELRNLCREAVRSGIAKEAP